jgi:hypothetical protein
MTFDDFRNAVSADAPPEGMTGGLLALWHDARGDWDTAHQVAQDVPDPEGAWVHAYLHRKEGDPGNAGYWYRRAGKPFATMTIQDEWAHIARALLSAGP